MTRGYGGGHGGGCCGRDGGHDEPSLHQEGGSGDAERSDGDAGTASCWQGRPFKPPKNCCEGYLEERQRHPRLLCALARVRSQQQPPQRGDVRRQQRVRQLQRGRQRQRARQRTRQRTRRRGKGERPRKQWAQPQLGQQRRGRGGSGSGHGTACRCLSALSSSSTGSQHGSGSSRHGSESAPPPIPENGELVGALDGSGGSGSSSPAGLLGEIGKQFSLALNRSFNLEGSDTGEASKPPPPVSKPRDPRTTAEKGLEDTSSHSEKTGVGRMAEGLLKQVDRAVPSISVGDGSGHGSGWGGSVSGAGGSAQGSAHGSVASVGALGSGVGGGSRRPSGLVLPWSQQDMDQGRDGGGGGGEDEATNLDADASGDNRFGRAFTGAGAGGGTPHLNDGGHDESMGPAERAFAAAFGGGGGGSGGGAVCSTPRVTSHPKLSFGTPVTERVVSTSTSASIYGTPSRVTPSASVFGTTLRGFAADTAGPSAGSTAGGSGHGSAGPVRKSSFAIEGVVAVDKVAGYEAGMANWPAGKVEGNPAWEEWSSAKKLVCHLVTAGCLAVIVLTW
ncbi:expressed unknown protein [Ectocarpus siliculosus]|uniref:Uncharacterized protein n=1 Tax=Ectocarpus siliculosus TaxID=2880 RepID=D7G440_ECTSI|nr:expressed unknown protein [Ectocarpus siliculosus]|eukprot:CBJ33658.1 expressed unknown protein [Ectocarpus siliculosus]